MLLHSDVDHDMQACGYFAGYLMGVPVTSYSLAIGEQHVEFAEAKIQARIITRDLSDAEIDGLAVVAVAGKALTTCSCRKLEVMWLGSPVQSWVLLFWG
jgi:hypothetical protein